MNTPKAGDLEAWGQELISENCSINSRNRLIKPCAPFLGLSSQDWPASISDTAKGNTSPRDMKAVAVQERVPPDPSDPWGQAK